MSIRRVVERNVVFLLVGSLCGGFLAGLVAYRTMLRVSGRTTITRPALRALRSDSDTLKKLQGEDAGKSPSDLAARPSGDESSVQDSVSPGADAPSRDQSTTVSAVVFRLMEAFAEGTRLTIVLQARNLGADRPIAVSSGRYPEIIDDQGATYSAVLATIGNQSWRSEVLHDASTAIVLTFNNLAPEGSTVRATEIKRLILPVSIGAEQELTVPFRSISIRK
jgi:hypothetical protein